jgi:hypothetical protein
MLRAASAIVTGASLAGRREGESMTTGPVPGIPDPTIVPPPAVAAGGKSGVLKWGLVGCTLVSAVLIVALVVLGMKARSILSWALARVEEQVLTGSSPEVTPEDRQAFRDAYAGFVERSRTGKVSPEEIRAFQKKVVEAMADGKITPEEIRSLAAAAAAGKKTGP